MSNHRLSIFILSVALLLISFTSIFAQGQRVMVKIERADYLRHDDKIGKNTQSLNGNVMLSHHKTVLYCDSAYMYNDSNVVVAYGNIHVIQNDSIHLYGNKLTYFGDKQLAKIRENVRANKGETWLYTEFLDFDQVDNKAYFYDGGKVVNGLNTLTSKRGIYYPNSNDVYFKDDVVGISRQASMYSDTMLFNTNTEITTILGPTTIINNDSSIINSEKGWYDTKADVAKLMLNNKITTKNYILTGETILYEKYKGVGKVWNNMVLTDTIDNMSLCGDYGFYNERTDEALATRKAIALQVYNGDTLRMHADTFRVVPLPEDTSRLIKAYHQVKFFRHDIQGRCDSLVFDFRDSIATMYESPVVWAMGNQMTGNVIKLYSRNQVLYKTELIEAAFAISPEQTPAENGDSMIVIGYNQVKGKLMTGYIRNNELYKIDVDGNGQTIYYPKDDQTLIGINRAESSNMTIWLKERKITNITMRVSPSGNMNPPLLLGEQDRKLIGFRWLDAYRPKRWQDVFERLDIPEELNIQAEVYEGYTFDELGE